MNTLREAWRLYRFVTAHPANEGRTLEALKRTFRWQVGSRILGAPAVVQWVGDSRLIVCNGMTGATGNIYAGLHEFADMAFVLHYLRPGDLFVDVGANVGSYTILAGVTCQALVVCFEPVPSTFASLLDNVRLNGCLGAVELVNAAAGDRAGELRFTPGLDTGNHAVLGEGTTEQTIAVPVKRIDDVLGGRSPTLIKIDVEGYEGVVLRGASEALAHASAVILELNGSGERYGSSDDDTFRALVSLGFRAARYDPRARRLSEAESPTPNGNTLMLRDLRSAQERVRSGGCFSIFGMNV